ncbi:glycoside hydrolase family 127 protein [Filimonas effusa]|uniref:Glycosyl hydrolase n=1 Tax=Filimonas effusa TaxID=2508721 RepID=A0A4Q1DAW8_9BACT|nr:glycoside hydrolase family 127 protein [Filimonas effusa]RXK86561.1 glycosyl hydrolase [Filimonas effusa]
MKKLSCLSLLPFLCILTGTPAMAQSESNSRKPFALADVRLLESPFKNAQEKDLEYILALKPDRLLAPYLREAGLTPKDSSYPNWENTGLDGHIGGHYVSALSLMYAATGNKEIATRLDYMLSELKKCQDNYGDGYIGGVPRSKQLWQEIAAGNIRADGFSLNKRWVPLYNIHKMYGGLRDAYLYAGSEQAKQMLIAYTNWMLKLTSGLSDAQVQEMLRSEHGGLNEVFADVAVITGDKKYLALARRFSHLTILTPLEHEQDKLDGLHANTQIPKVIGFKSIADAGDAQDTAYDKAAHFFWETVVHNRSCVIGGNSVREHFNPVHDFSSMINDIQGPETCNTYNMLKLTRQLYLSDGRADLIDYYERALYNHILSTENPEKGGFVYFTSMRPGAYRVYSQPQTSFWCCVGSGLENHAKYGELIYAHAADSLFVNLFIPSELKWKEKNISIVQQNRFPSEEHTSLTIHAAAPAKFALQIRYPSWVKAGTLAVFVNGRKQVVTATPGDYVAIERTWKEGDVVTVQLPMQTTFEELPHIPSYVAVMRGPIVLAAKAGTEGMTGLYADDSRGGHIAPGIMPALQDMPVLVSDDNKDAVVIPAGDKKNTFRFASKVYPDKYNDIELVPFYTLHDTRYIIYWHKLSQEDLQQDLDRLKKQQEQEAALAARTIDMVAPGEQQPESDHFIESDKSITGIHRNRHWRSAKGWFSYRLRNEASDAATLQVTYYGGDKNRHFHILINDKPIAEVKLDGTKGGDFFSAGYVIPDGAAKTLVVKFVAVDGSETAGIYGVRLLRK